MLDEQEVLLEKWFDSFWLDDEFDPNKIFTSLASKHRDGQHCVTGKLFLGSFHLCVRVLFDDGVAWIIRVPLPFRLLRSSAHTKREVAILQYLHEHTAIPVPRVIACGFDDAEHPGLGPFIIMTFAHGIPLTDWWKVRGVEETRLRPDIEDWIVRKVYGQVAAILLELTSLKFSAIGTLAMTGGALPTWSVESSPWAITLHEAERNHAIQPRATNGPFTSAHDWLSYITEHHEQIIREIPGTTQSADLESLARFRELAPRFMSDSNHGDFRLHCDDFGASNMLVDGEYNVVCIGDWEFTYTAPSEYQCCLASWLILSKPHTWSHEDHDRYSRQLDLFLRVLEEEEDRRADTTAAGRVAEPAARLSSVMRRGWVDGTFWFVLCARSGLFFDDLWARFRKFRPEETRGRPVLGAEQVLGEERGKETAETELDTQSP